MVKSMKFAADRAWQFMRVAAFFPLYLIVGKALFIMVMGAADPLPRHFLPLEITVPDHCRGTDPDVRYTRVIFKDWTGRFDTRFDRADDVTAAPVLCSFPGLSLDYHRKPKGETRLPFTAFFQCPRALPAGSWRGRVTWTRVEPWRPLQTVTLATNLFDVSDCK